MSIEVLLQIFKLIEKYGFSFVKSIFDVWKKDTVTLEDIEELKTKIKKQYKSNKKVLIVGDSFGECMSKLAKKFYKKVGFVHIYNFSMKQVKGYDYVIWESVERYQDKYSRINFAAK